MILFYITILLLLIYGALVIYYWLGWRSIPEFAAGTSVPQTSISVVIPARNEAANIGALLDALQQQTYPVNLFEIIVVDDHSTDNTAAIASGFANVRVLSLRDDAINSYKKKAIETGIAASTADLVVTTDADCIPGPQWLTTIAAFREKKKAVFIAAPVLLNCNSTILQIFQTMDFMVLQGITGAAVEKKSLSMCNGANLSYERKVFHEVGGFAGIDHIASGDDMLLMHKVHQLHPADIHYLRSKDAIMRTNAMDTWKGFFNQRIRWASKAAKYDDKRIFIVLLLVYLVNLCFPLLLLGGFFDQTCWLYALVWWVGKTLVELPLFIAVVSFFNKRWMIMLFFLFQPLHILYTLVSGLFGQFGSYEWKGRRVK